MNDNNDNNDTKTLPVSRRQFLKGAASTGAVGLAPVAMANAAVETQHETQRVVVIGSGFGGGVVTRALTRAGVKVLLLERGREWKVSPGADELPHFLRPDKRTAWLSHYPAIPFSPPAIFPKYVGILERVRGWGINVIAPAAVGGGSISYHGVTLQPGRDMFKRWISNTIDYDLMDRDHFRRVEKDLKVSVPPADVLDHPEYNFARNFIDLATKAGFKGISAATPTDWDVVRKEFSGEYTPSMTNGDMVYGSNNGGRYSVDLTYLAEAGRTGNLELAPLHRVNDVERLDNGKWRVHSDHINESGAVLKHRIITCDAVFLCAGSAGTTRLMVKAKVKRLIPDLPKEVGHNWGNNGERVYLLTATPESKGPSQAGPVTSVATKWEDPEAPLTFATGSQPSPLDKVGFTVAAHSTDEARGRWYYNPFHDDAFPVWKRSDQAPLKARLDDAVRAIAKAGSPSFPIDTNLINNVTFHPVGGMSMGAVCDDYGRVHNQKGLYVADGSLLPGNCASVNPSMTIAALAEYAMDDILANDLDTIF